MILPQDVRDKINLLFTGKKDLKLKSTREGLTNKYKSNSGSSVDLIENENESILYAISRMPATFAVIYKTINDLCLQGYIKNIESVIDAGSGTGAGFFALRELFPSLSSHFLEKNYNMIDTFNKICNEKIEVNQFDLIKNEITLRADLILSSYVLSELSENDRISVFKKLLSASNRYVLIIDTGTPETYTNFMKLKSIAIQNGFKVLAPCESDNCPLKNDYCQFYARVERSSLLKVAKSATLSYEDEKYFYLLLAKESVNFARKRVLRRPKIKKNEIKLVLCTQNGIEQLKVTRNSQDEFKRAKKIKINEEF